MKPNFIIRCTHKHRTFLESKYMSLGSYKAHHVHLPLYNAPYIGLFQATGPHVQYDMFACEVESVFGENLSITGQVPSVSKFNRLHVDIFRFSFINLRYIQ